MNSALRRSVVAILLALSVAAFATSTADAKLRHLYTYSFTVQVSTMEATLPIQGGLPGLGQLRAAQELRRCFNCSFPVKGAPKRYPRNGQTLPLVVCFFACKPAPVKAYTSLKGGSFQYLKFVALPGHFDGAGSEIYFRFGLNADGQLRLTVSGYVAKPTAPDAANKTLANATWRMFANRLGMNMWNHQNCRPICKN